MKSMVGIDLHNNNACCGSMDENGQWLVHKKLPYHPTAMLQLVDPFKDRIARPVPCAISCAAHSCWCASAPC